MLGGKEVVFMKKFAKTFTAAAMIAAMALIAGCGGGSDKQAAPSGGKVTLKMAAHLPQSHRRRRYGLEYRRPLGKHRSGDGRVRPAVPLPDL